MQRKTMRARSVGERFAQVLKLLAVSALVASALGCQGHGQLASAAKPLPTLTHADQVRSLSPEQAGLGYPVLIRGVITMDAPSPDFIVQDATAGIYVEGSVSPKYPHILSQLVEVEGVTGPGKFAPVIRETKLRVLGEGVLPKAQLFSLSELANGQQDSQWAQVRGIVRSAAVDRTSWREPALAMRIASEGGEFHVRVPIAHEQDFSSWVDSEVLIEGVCGSLYNTEPAIDGHSVLRSSLELFDGGSAGYRSSFVGVVAVFARGGHAAPGASARHCRLPAAGQGAVSAESRQGTACANRAEYAGSRSEILSKCWVSPPWGNSAPMIEDAVFHRLGHEEYRSLEARPRCAVGTIRRRVVTTDAKLVNRQDQPDGLRLMLQRGDISFRCNAAGRRDSGTPAVHPA